MSKLNLLPFPQRFSTEFLMERKLKKLRKYIASGKWKKYGKFSMESLDISLPTGKNGESEEFLCLAGIVERRFGTMERLKYAHLKDYIWEFLFSSKWVKFDNTVSGALGRIDAVLEGYFT